ncbi:hypothetical protein DFJ73DRAFT_798117 [Zopfochytrium polystomum]|nr:hypothetical protein DFJ73DRAFT_798117 [Zopfochytrium polystomum]
MTKLPDAGPAPWKMTPQGSASTLQGAADDDVDHPAATTAHGPPVHDGGEADDYDNDTPLFAGTIVLVDGGAGGGGGRSGGNATGHRRAKTAAASAAAHNAGTPSPVRWVARLFAHGGRPQQSQQPPALPPPPPPQTPHPVAAPQPSARQAAVRTPVRLVFTKDTDLEPTGSRIVEYALNSDGTEGVERFAMRTRRVGFTLRRVDALVGAFPAATAAGGPSVGDFAAAAGSAAGGGGGGKRGQPAGGGGAGAGGGRYRFALREEVGAEDCWWRREGAAAASAAAAAGGARAGRSAGGGGGGGEARSVAGRGWLRGSWASLPPVYGGRRGGRRGRVATVGVGDGEDEPEAEARGGSMDVGGWEADLDSRRACEARVGVLRERVYEVRSQSELTLWYTMLCRAQSLSAPQFQPRRLAHVSASASAAADGGFDDDGDDLSKLFGFARESSSGDDGFRDQSHRSSDGTTRSDRSSLFRTHSRSRASSSSSSHSSSPSSAASTVETAASATPSVKETTPALLPTTAPTAFPAAPPPTPTSGGTPRAPSVSSVGAAAASAPVVVVVPAGFATFGFSVDAGKTGGGGGTAAGLQQLVEVYRTRAQELRRRVLVSEWEEAQVKGTVERLGRRVERLREGIVAVKRTWTAAAGASAGLTSGRAR